MGERFTCLEFSMPVTHVFVAHARRDHDLRPPFFAHRSLRQLLALLENGQQVFLLASEVLNFSFHLGKPFAKNLFMRLIAFPCQQLADVSYRSVPNDALQLLALGLEKL